MNNSKTIRAWCMFDWANSAYNLVITTTFFPIYFGAIMQAGYGDSVPLFGSHFTAISLYNYAVAIGYFVSVLILPLLSSIADTRGNKKSFMQFFTYLGGFACIGLFWFRGEHPPVELGLLCFILAAIGYNGSLVFYNSYLPEIATPDKQDAVSARGYTMGYIGSVLLQLVGFALVLYFQSKKDDTSGVLYTFALTGLWWIVFAQITFINMPRSKKIKTDSAIYAGYVELKKVWHQIKDYRTMKAYLLAFFMYSMGVQTVMLVATIVGQKILGLPADKLIATVVVIQLFAIPGAMLMSKLSGKYGNFAVLRGVVILWVFICVAAYVMITKRESGIDVEYFFYGLATAVGLVMGGIQSLSRSTYSKLMPETKDTASFFSFYDVTEKLAIVLGTFSFGYMNDLYGTKHSVLLLGLYFIAGWVVLKWASRVEKKTIEAN